MRDLRTFLAVAEELHFGRAAARLFVVPAAVSQRVRALEDELGVALFERTSRRVVLTGAGQRLLGPVRAAVAQVAALEELAGSLARGASGHARLALAPNLGSIGARFVAGVVRALPEVEAVAASQWGAEAVDALEAGEVLAALVRGPVDREGIAAQVVGGYRDDHLALPADDPLASADVVPLRALAGRSVLLPDAAVAPLVHQRTVACFAEHGVEPRWRSHRMSTFDQIAAFVAAGYAVALVHSHLAATALPGVALRPLEPPGPRYEVVLAWREGESSPELDAVRAVGGRLHEEVAERGAGS